MEHLTGKLIREKVVQQYYFEKFLCGKAKKMLPKSGEFDRYTISDNVKMLHPEQDIVTKAEADAEGFEGAYKPDFILYPSKKSLEELNEVVNIEIKWKASAFSKETIRHPWFKGDELLGRIQRGFVVAFKDDRKKDDDDNFINWPDDSEGNPIDLVILDEKDFGDWFVNNSNNIVDQALSAEDLTYSRRIPRYWVIYLSGQRTDANSETALDNYKRFGKTGKKWAFSDIKNSADLMPIAKGDYAIFINFSKGPANRQVMRPRSVGEWYIGLCDIFRITTGYHHDFSEGCFEDEEWRDNMEPLKRGKSRKHEDGTTFSAADLNNERTLFLTKEYTQFFKFSTNDDEKGKTWDWDSKGPPGRTLSHKSFQYSNENHRNFVTQLSKAFGSQRPREISKSSFRALHQLLKP
jgi:hypothetical protein